MRAAVAITLLFAASVVPLGSSDEPGVTVSGDYTVYAAPSGLGDFAGEPSIGVNHLTGNVMVQAFTETLRVEFDDSVSPARATWAAVQPLQTGITNNDPILFTDQTTGRTWAGGLNPPCSILAMTDDDGQTWLPVGNACALPAFDHETIGSGPWRGAKPAQATYDRAFYYCAQEIVQQCAVSYDGGITFSAGVVINPTLACSGLFGHIKVAADGYAWVPPRRCSSGGENVAGAIYTPNNGLTWVTRMIPGSFANTRGFDPSIATTPSGWAYVAYEGANGRPHVSVTKNHATSWSAPVDVAPESGITRATFLAAVAGDNERVAVAYVGTTGEGDPFAANFTGTWDLYVSTSIDTGVTWTTQKVTTDPVQRGWICASGTACPLGADGSQPGRNLLDFMDATLDKSGRILVAFADGCIGACTAGGTTADSQESKMSIARQTGGVCLVSGGCGEASGTPIPPRFDDQCSSNLVIFSSNSAGTPAVNSHALLCIASASNPGIDTAFINPASDRVSLRYTQDLGPSVPTLTATVNGLGASATVTLNRTALATGGFTYNGPNVPIDPTAVGDIVAVVYQGSEELDRVVFHTVL